MSGRRLAFPWLRPLPVVLGIVAALLAVANPAAAQAELTLADFDDTGLDVELLALIEAGTQDTVYATPPRGAAGSLLDGELGLGPGETLITRIRLMNAGETIALNDNDLNNNDLPSELSLSQYFGTGGDGDDLTLYLQTDDHVTDLAVADSLNNAGGSFVNFNVTAVADQADVSVIGNGDRFIIAFARPLAVGALNNLQSAAETTTTISLSWDAATDADGYRIQWREQGSGDPFTEATTTATTHTITGLEADTTYTIMVFGTLTGQDDGPGATATISTASLSPPGQVAGVSATADDHDSITVAWTAATDADGYRVEWGTTSGSYTDSATTAATSYTITGLNENTTHYVRVVSTRTGAADGAPSDEESAATRPSPPGQVTGVATTAASDTSIAVSWDAATDADGYRIEWGDNSGDYSLDSATTLSTSHTVTGLTANTTYYLRVVATRTGASDGTPSAEDSVATHRFPAPAQVTGVSATADDYDSITVSWTAATDADAYTAQWRTASEQWGAHEASASASPHVITGLAEDTAYSVRVIATRTAAADALPSDAASASTALQPPAQVANVSASAASDTEIAVSWNNAVRAGGYIVQWRTTSQSFNATRQAVTTSLNHTISGLVPDTAYHVRVISARAGADNGPASAEDSAHTETARPPAQVTGVSATALSDSEIQVEWNVAQHATGYLAQWRQDGEAFDSSREAVVSGAGVIIEYLRAETEYFVRVIGTRAYAANGPASAADSATTGQARFKVWSDRFPGGALAAQLALAAFGGALSGVKFRRMKSPMREAAILIVICLASLILPIMGVGNIFWTGGIALLIALSSIAVIFLASRH